VPPAISIRKARFDADHALLRGCVVALQDFERSLEPRLPRGEEMADDYLDFLRRNCVEHQGEILIATIDNDCAGFACVLTDVPPSEPDEPRSHYAYVSDLLVHAEYRGLGLGRRLLEEAELVARSNGAPVLRIGVLASNHVARELYGKLGFVEYHVQLIKAI
jgi:ribosomal protein S18 acetylase RimI-like enzyme